MFPRAIIKKFKSLVATFPVVALTGPRQSGKTTLAKELFGQKYRYVSLEDLDARNFAQSDPRGFLAEYNEKVIIDEAQLVPDLFSYLQGVVDNNDRPGQYILTGSQHFLLHQKISQSLSGRAAFLHLLPLSIQEIKNGEVELPTLEKTLYQGFYPRIYASRVKPADWYSNYLRTYVERDLRQIKNIHDLGTFQTFLKMCASRAGQLLDLTSIGNDCGISHNTVKGWLNILEASFIIFLLRPHYKNFGKRLVKTQKLYFYDTGLLSHLLDIQSPKQLSTHYLRGGIFESFVFSEILKKRYSEGREPHLYFWRDNHGHEVDGLIEVGERILSLEIKSSKTVNDQFFSGLRYWQGISERSAKDSYLIYGGEASMKRKDAQVISWDTIHECF